MNPFNALKKNLSPFHITSLFHLSYQPFTSLYFANHANHIYTLIPFTFYRLHFPSLGKAKTLKNE